METQTRYDLNTAFENWRAELAAQPNLTAEVRRELETHLRDAIAGFQQRGLNDEESFWLACKRVGRPQQLGEEFCKIDPVAVWRERIFWMWLALFLSNTLGSIGYSLAVAVRPLSTQAANAVVAWEILQITLLFVSMLIPLVLAIGLAKGKWVGQFSKLMQIAGNRRRLTMTALACILLSSTVRIVSWEIFISKSHLRSDVVWPNSIPSASYALITGLLLVWLMPSQNRKTPKRA